MPRVHKTGEAKRHVVSARITPAVWAKLEKAVAESGRSLAAEVEHRLACSFDYADCADYLRGLNIGPVCGTTSGSETSVPTQSTLDRQ